MKKLACLYFEGNDSKIVLFSRDKNNFKLLNAKSIESSQAFSNKKAGLNSNTGSEDNLFYYDTLSEEAQAYNNSYLQKLNGFLSSENLKEYEFIPILTEPGVYFQRINNEKVLASLSVPTKGKNKDKNKTLSFVKMSDNSKLAVYPSGQVNYLQALDSLAKLNGMRHLKIAKVKCAEISLVSYITQTNEINQDAISLIIYFGKEYTKLLFIKGDKLIHLSATLSVGRNNSKINNVVISKILYEREHALIDSLDNIFIYGEKISDEFIINLQTTYPSSFIKQFPKEQYVDYPTDIKDSSSWSSFSVPIAVANEYFEELNKKTTGIDLLPSYIREQQKNFQLAWHGIALLVAMFIAVMFSTNQIFTNEFQIKKMDSDIKSLLMVQKQNQETVDRITNLNNKINNAEKTKLFLDQISTGSGVWAKNMAKLSDFTNERRNIWIQNIKIEKANLMIIGGFSTSRWVLPVLKRSYNNSSLEFIHYEPMRNRNTYEFNLKMNSLNTGQ